jgi:hypothetical protein
LTDYYAESGTPPGVFLGAGLVSLDNGRGIEKGSEVSEDHLWNLLGMCAVSRGGDTPVSHQCHQWPPERVPTKPCPYGSA